MMHHTDELLQNCSQKMSAVKLSKSYILSRCSYVLDELQLLMSQFHSIDDKDDGDYDEDDSLWWDDKNNNDQLLLCDSFDRSLTESDILWPVFSSSPTTQEKAEMFSTTMTPATDMGTSDTAAKMIDVADTSKEMIDMSAPSEEMNETAATSEEMMEMSATNKEMMTNLLTAIQALAPNSIYNMRKAKRMRMKKMKRRICPELRTIWTNVSAILSPSQKSTTTSSQYPCVDWTVVNKRFISNIPSPSPQPVHSCSQDEAIYHDKTYFEAGGTRQVVKATFTKPNPFGTIPGYLTNQGVIAVPLDNSFHGYTWIEKEGWVLDAKYPLQKKMMRRMKRTKKKSKMRK